MFVLKQRKKKDQGYQIDEETNIFNNGYPNGVQSTVPINGGVSVNKTTFIQTQANPIEGGITIGKTSYQTLPGEGMVTMGTTNYENSNKTVENTIMNENPVQFIEGNNTYSGSVPIDKGIALNQQTIVRSRTVPLQFDRSIKEESTNYMNTQFTPINEGISASQTSYLPPTLTKVNESNSNEYIPTENIDLENSKYGQTNIEESQNFDFSNQIITKPTNYINTQSVPINGSVSVSPTTYIAPTTLPVKETTSTQYLPLENYNIEKNVNLGPYNVN